MKEFKISEVNNRKIDVMVFKIFNDDHTKVMVITREGDNFDNINKAEVIANSEEEYFAKIEIEKQENQRKLEQKLLKEKQEKQIKLLAKIEQEKYEQQKLLQERERFSENAIKSAKGNSFALFMGIPWKTNAMDFLKYFKYKSFPFSMGFMLNNFPLGNTNIKKIAFFFKSNERTLNFKKSNYSKFYFESVFMSFEPDQFESILDVFKTKYGKTVDIKEYEIQNRMGAKFSQKEVFWKNKDRVIHLTRYGNKIDEGIASFQSIEESQKDIEKQKEENKKAADIL